MNNNKKKTQSDFVLKIYKAVHEWLCAKFHPFSLCFTKLLISSKKSGWSRAGTYAVFSCFFVFVFFFPSCWSRHCVWMGGETAHLHMGVRRCYEQPLPCSAHRPQEVQIFPWPGFLLINSWGQILKENQPSFFLLSCMLCPGRSWNLLCITVIVKSD